MVIYEKAPAKINLSLDVKYKRDDGYHEVEMIMTSVDLADRLEFRELPDDRVVLSSSAGHLPLDEKNLAYQAALLLKKTYGIRRGVHIHLVKNIPVAAGLAGGSSDAAATFRGLNRLWGLSLSLEEMLHLAERLGSDVPFCVLGKTAIAKGRGEKLEWIPAPPPCWVILAKPPLNVSTADVYSRLNVQNIRRHPDTGRLLAALRQGDFREMCRSLGNVLEEVTLELYPEVRRIKEGMLKFGADGALMSGSGPTVFGLVEKEKKVARIVNSLRGFCREVHAVRLLG